MTRARNGAVSAASARAAADLPRRETRTEADMRGRYDTIKLRLPRGYKARLQRLSDEDGRSVSEWVAAMVDGAESESADLRPRKRGA